MSKKKPIGAQSKAIHRDVSKCGLVVSSLMNGKDLPLFLGYDKKEDKYLISIGEGELPYKLNKEDVAYLSVALIALMEKHNKMTGSKEQNFTDYVSDQLNSNKLGIVVGSNKKGPTETDSLNELINKVMKDARADPEDEVDEGTEENLENYDSVKEASDDFNKVIDDMSEEELEKIAAAVEQERNEQLEKRSQALEKTLLGTLQSEEKIVYDYAYFKKIHDEKGNEFLREELAKISKEERLAIIKQITEEITKEQNIKLQKKDE